MDRGGGTVDGVGEVAVLVEQGGDMLQEGGTGRRRRGGDVGIFDEKRRRRGGSWERRGTRRGFVWRGVDGENGREMSKNLSFNYIDEHFGTLVSRYGINWKR
jgi:hypothetical protein